MRLPTIIIAVLVFAVAVVVTWKAILFHSREPEAVIIVQPVPVYKLDPWTPAFAEGVQADLAAGRYAKLDAEAAEYRHPDAMFVSGIPKLDRFYGALAGDSAERAGCGCSAKVVDFDTFRTRLEAWRAVDPQSLAANISLAELWLNYAWAARGDDESVSSQQWSLVEARLPKVQYYLASADPEKDPLVYYLRISSGMLEDGNRARLADYYRRGIAAFPWYFPYYSQRANVVSEDWYGLPGEERSYLEDLRSPGNGMTGQIAYSFAAYQLFEANYRTDLFKSAKLNALDDMRSPDSGIVGQLLESLYASELLTKPEQITLSRSVGLDFPAVIHAYQIRQQQYGLRDHDWAAIFSMSLAAYDCLTAHVALVQIGSRWDPDIWAKREYFDTDVAWFHKNSAY